jgi:hypothetical protein
MPPALDFPASPTVGQKYPSPAVAGVPVYSWDGEKWTTLGGALGSTGASDVIPLIDAGAGAAGSSTLWSRGDHAHPADPIPRAPVNNPVLTGDPKAPTPTAGDNDTSIATTAFVSGAISTAVGGIPGAPSAVVRYDIAQSLTAPQLIQARQNVYAAPFDAMAYGGLQINGGMEVSQERGTGITSAIGSYICDGWKFFYSGTMVVNGAIASAAGWFAGFPSLLYMNLGVAQTTIGAADYTLLQQFIEGYRVARLQWGTANAQPITIGFWSAHHRPGLYSGVVRNGANNRTYAFTYTQAAADVPQYNVITVPGDTAGTWATDNTVGLVLTFALACGSTNTAPSANAWLAGSYAAAPGQINAVAATTDVFRITGVIVLPGNEAPSAARSPFVMRPYDQELLICQRYYQRMLITTLGYYSTLAGGSLYTSLQLKTLMRAAPTAAQIGNAPTLGGCTYTLTSTSQCDLRVDVNAIAVGQNYVAGLTVALDARL